MVNGEPVRAAISLRRSRNMVGCAVDQDVIAIARPVKLARRSRRLIDDASSSAAAPKVRTLGGNSLGMHSCKRGRPETRPSRLQSRRHGLSGCASAPASGKFCSRRRRPRRPAARILMPRHEGRIGRLLMKSWWSSTGARPRRDPKPRRGLHYGGQASPAKRKVGAIMADVALEGSAGPAFELFEQRSVLRGVHRSGDRLDDLGRPGAAA